jgi:hypothetical protein
MTEAKPRIDDSEVWPVARNRKDHRIGEFANRLPSSFADRERFVPVDRISDYVFAHRYREEKLSRPPPPVSSVAEAQTWIAEVEALEADFQRWLA